MAREIKFRGKNTINGNFVEGYYNVDKGHHFINAGHTLYPVHPWSIEQFTGLRDKNGVDIYEGDIVSYDATPYNVNGLKAKGVIAMIKNSWALKYKSKWGDSSGYGYYNLGCEDFFHKKSEIIGNIHENKELLNQ